MMTHWQVAMNDDVIVFKQLEELKSMHRELDEEIRELEGRDELQIARLKKRKLQLRDQIMTLEFELYPDEPA